MVAAKTQSSATVPRDLTAGLVVFLVALPLCLGVALASGAPLLAGILSGIVGGIVVGLLSGSQSSVSGPAAGLTAVVVTQIGTLGFQGFLLAVVLAGVIQIGLGLLRAGFIAAFIPSGVIKGLLAAIGIILILKQIPHVLGHDPDPEGDMSFQQIDHQNTFSAFVELLDDIQLGATVIGLLSIALLMTWDRIKTLKYSPIPAPLIVVLLGVGLSQLFRMLGAPWAIEDSHLVQVPVASSLKGFLDFLTLPDFSQFSRQAVYVAAVTLAAVASLETLLNLEAVDKLDPQQRSSPPSRELVAQGVGNVISGMIGGLPVTSVIVRSSVNINAGGQTKLATVVHGVLLLVSVVLLPVWLNLIPLSCLAAILFVTGLKLVSPALIKQMWNDGRYQFIPFAITVVTIVFTDLLVGVITGLLVSLTFILWSNARRPMRRIVEKHLGGEVVHIELANQVSFLNRAVLSRCLEEVPNNGQLLIDASGSDYIDPDVLALLRDFKEQGGPARGIEVSFKGFRSKYELNDQIQFVDYSTRELQDSLTPHQALLLLKEGHERFHMGRRLTRDLSRQVSATAMSQHPFAVVVSCIDSRAPSELIFDLGVGDIFSVRIAGNVLSPNVLGSVEYACSVVGVKLILVMGHTRCGAVTAAVNMIATSGNTASATGCEHLESIVAEIRKTVDPSSCQHIGQLTTSEQEKLIDSVAKNNMQHVARQITERSQTLRTLVQSGRVAVVGAMYDVVSGEITFMET